MSLGRTLGTNEGLDDSRLSMRDERARGGGRGMRTLIVVLVAMAALLVLALLGFMVLSSTSAFTITSIDTEDTEHLDADNIAKLANVAEGTTLLNFDEQVITDNLKRNPWVGEVSYTREFPDRLKITVRERVVDCIVKMSTGSVCWCLGNDLVWIEPVNLSILDGQSADDAAIALSQRMGALLIIDVPTSMSPSAGSEATDEVLKAVNLYREQFSPDLSEQIVCFSAASPESISCTLKSGVEVSLGAPSNVDLKEAVIREILEQHPNQVTYINVRVPTQPSYRKLGVENVTQGTGITVETTNVAPSNPSSSADQESSEEKTDENDTSRMVLGEDGNYYSYEDYYGMSYEEYYGLSDAGEGSYEEDYSTYNDSGYEDYGDYSQYDEYSEEY